MSDGAWAPFYIAVATLTTRAVVHERTRPVVAPSAKLAPTEAVGDLDRWKASANLVVYARQLW